MKTFKKHCYTREIEIYKIAEKHGIAPPIVTTEGRNLTTICMNPITGDWKKYEHKINALIAKLHDLGIIWLDVHLGNVVIDDNDQPFLIDFDSILISDIYKYKHLVKDEAIENVIQELKKEKIHGAQVTIPLHEDIWEIIFEIDNKNGELFIHNDRTQIVNDAETEFDQETEDEILLVMKQIENGYYR